MERAPLVVFVYNRLQHAENCISSLALVEGAKETDLFVFSDGPRPGTEDKVETVRNFVNSKKVASQFRSVTVYESEKNNGLAVSVIRGVDKVVAKYGSCIVVEDDNVVSNDFLNFMNSALSYYKNNKTIWSIAGFSLVNQKLSNDDVYFLGRVCSYAWGIWIDRWEMVDWDVNTYSSFRHNWTERRKFNAFGTDRSNMLDRQMMGQINSWAIRFDYAAFKANMLTVYPSISRVKNYGNDGSGTHFTESTNRLDVQLEEANSATFVDEIKIVDDIRKEFCTYYGLRWQARLKRIILRDLRIIKEKWKLTNG